jgi:hypothetical protein
MDCGALHCTVALVDVFCGVGLDDGIVAGSVVVGVVGVVVGVVVVVGVDVPLGEADALFPSLPPPPQPASANVKQATARTAGE